MLDAPGHIALFRLSALGDVTLMLPLVRTLQKQWPNTRLTWIIGKGVYPLMEGLSGVEFLVIEKPRSIKDYYRLHTLFQHHKFDVLLAMQASFRTNLIYPHIKADRKIGFDNSRARDLHRFFINEQIDSRNEHLADGFLGFARKLGIQKQTVKWGLYVPEVDRRWANTLRPSVRPWIAINPVASKAERTWLPDRYASVIDKAHRQWGCDFVLTGGPQPAEIELAKDIEQIAETPILNLVGKTSYKKIAALLTTVDLLIAPDTGPVHIAVAVDTPVIGLYAVARPELSGPYQQGQYTVNRYPEAVDLYLNKSPDTASWHERVHEDGAMALITVGDVLERLRSVLEI